jgi:hypothetical protein
MSESESDTVKYNNMIGCIPIWQRGVGVRAIARCVESISSFVVKSISSASAAHINLMLGDRSLIGTLIPGYSNSSSNVSKSP